MHTGALVLVVDDDPSFRVMLTQLLEQDGYAAIAAAGADRALARLAETPADVVVTDLVMPGRSGLSLLIDLHMEHPDVPAIAMTGDDDRVMRDAARALGARRVLRKPFRSDELLRAVDAVLTAGAGERVYATRR